MKKSGEHSSQLSFLILLIFVAAIAIGPRIIKQLNTANVKTESMALTVTAKETGTKKTKITTGHKHGSYKMTRVYYLTFDTSETEDADSIERAEVSEAEWNNVQEGDRLVCKVKTRTLRDGSKDVEIQTDCKRAEE